jgi:ribose 5-phosphate isomerase A
MKNRIDAIKKAIGKYAASLVPHDGLIGLGSGTTSHEFICALGERYRQEKLGIKCLATSTESEKLAKEKGLPIMKEDAWDGFLDMTFDGADFLNSDGSAIKGAGGALLREKIVAKASKKLILMVDERKWMAKTMTVLPVDIVRFGSHATLLELSRMGYKGTLRKSKQEEIFCSDDGHWIVDIELDLAVGSWETIDQSLKSIPGVVGTGIFFKMAHEAIIGFLNGEIIHQRFESKI